MKEKEKEKRYYTKRVYRDEAQIIAIIRLKDCADLSFLNITRLLGLKDSSKRNVEYTYNANKDKYKCQQINKLKEQLK
jgi:hypothetical protein